MTQTDYLALLEASLQYVISRDDDHYSRLEFLADHVFDFTTYDSVVSKRFAIRVVDVVAAITDGKTHGYISTSDGHYEWYLLMVNMPFFADRLEWGTSIRGAWWRHQSFELDSTGWLVDGVQTTEPMRFTRDEWLAFMRAVVEFARPEMTS